MWDELYYKTILWQYQWENRACGGTGLRVGLKNLWPQGRVGSSPTMPIKNRIMIIFTKHAENKFEILKRHKFFITKKWVLETIEKPELIDKSRLPLLIAQRKIDTNRVLRVVYKKEFEVIKIITFYPGRRKQYEK